MTEPYSAEDLRIAKSILKQYCTESDDHDFPQEECRKCDGMAYDFAVAIAKVRRERDQAAATERAGMREACANVIANEIRLRTSNEHVLDHMRPISELEIEIRKLPDTAADEALDNLRDSATEAALPLACKAIIESLDSGEFSAMSPLAKVTEAIERVKAAARLDEAKFWKEITDRFFKRIQMAIHSQECQERIAELKLRLEVLKSKGER